MTSSMMGKTPENYGEIVIFQSQDGLPGLDVRMERETVHHEHAHKELVKMAREREKNGNNGNGRRLATQQSVDQEALLDIITARGREVAEALALLRGRE